MTEALEQHQEVWKRRPEWEQEMTALSVIYRIKECGDKIPMDTTGTEYSFVEPFLDIMHHRDLIEIEDKTHIWKVMPKGEKLIRKMVEMFDHAMKFEIFHAVRLDRDLNEDEEGEDGLVLDNIYDPRFEYNPRNHDFEDMRLAVMTFLADQGNLTLDPRRVVFLQMLINEEIKTETFWFDLRAGTLSREINEIIEFAYRWTDIADDEEEAAKVMEVLYSAGMIEQRKRDGYECSGCKIPLAMFEYHAQENGEELTECPNPSCGADFSPPPPPQGEASFECPQCNRDVYPSQHKCACGAFLDFSLPEGHINTSTETVVETTEEEEYYSGAFGYGYGYDPYPYYHPFDPYYDLIAFGCLAAILW